MQQQDQPYAYYEQGKRRKNKRFLIFLILSLLLHGLLVLLFLLNTDRHPVTPQPVELELWEPPPETVAPPEPEPEQETPKPEPSPAFDLSQLTSEEINNHNRRDDSAQKTEAKAQRDSDPEQKDSHQSETHDESAPPQDNPQTTQDDADNETEALESEQTTQPSAAEAFESELALSQARQEQADKIRQQFMSQAEAKKQIQQAQRQNRAKRQPSPKGKGGMQIKGGVHDEYLSKINKCVSPYMYYPNQRQLRAGVRVQTNRAGLPVSVNIITSSGDRHFDQAVIQAFTQCKHYPTKPANLPGPANIIELYYSFEHN
ncbi:cell envelope integrity protein TolA [Brackiella oedipodis]|uniref:cell envelope integrity protein TolA n=1 Tax=Brackiella oedipodis TaxID=124225 RepID=UPI00048DF978|nr:cell envelope integrity protein TolA [Brackiella oedipodis]